MSQDIKLQGSIYRIHPVYNLYAAIRHDFIIRIFKIIPLELNINNSGYKSVVVKKYGDKHPKKMRAHRFIWECCNCLIPEGKVIDRINNIRIDNRLSNLQLLTPSENVKKSSQNRDYVFAKDGHKNKKAVKVINCRTGEESFF